MSATWEVDLDDGKLTLRSGQTQLGSVRGWCRLESGQIIRTDVWRQRSGSAEVSDLAAICGPIEVQMRVDPGERLLIRLGGAALTTVTVMEIGWDCVPVINGDDPQWFLYNGYQSWDSAGHLPIGTQELTSWWTCGLARTAGDCLALAAIRPGEFVWKFHWTGVRLSTTLVRTVPDGPELPLWQAEAQATFAGEPMALCVGAEPSSALATASQPVTPTLRKSTPRGWLSWYQIGPLVGRDDVTEMAAVLQTEPWSTFRYQVLQIDDGWQMAYGDWKPNTKFQPDFSALATALTAQGRTLGLWIAPFLVSISSDLAETAPESWFLRDPKTGERLIDPRHVVLGPMQVLDPSNSKVIEHLDALFSGFYEQGIRYFKIDFLYAGGYGGIWPLRRALSRIQKAIHGSYLVTCGAPMLTVAGLADACRIGQDTATPVFDSDRQRAEGVVFGDAVMAIARNLAARRHLRDWFRPDADVALVGDTLTLPEARQLVSLVTLSGGPFFASDRLQELSPERTALLTNPEILALAGTASATPAWEPNPHDLPPTTWWLPGPGGSRTLGLFDWERKDRTFQVPIPGRWVVRDLWQQSRVGIIEDMFETTIGSQGAGIFRFQPLQR